MPNTVKVFFHDIKYLLLVSTVIFTLSLFFGFYLESRLEGSFFSATDHTTMDIFQNNIKASVPFILGFVSLGVSTVAALLINGVAIGGSILASTDHLSTVQIILLLIPHGILEIPALMLSSTIGFYSLKILFLFIRGKSINLKHELMNVGKLLILVLVLFVTAAFVEANITTVFHPFTKE
ncbi:stage II sporulation protein M (plasmid) [Rossellomorea sp. FS2]|uniref:stage II sporulation protein M n=1 Tax=Rossellomorea sp. FS2 TaxID=3391447 RepID=UPI003A4E6534